MKYNDKMIYEIYQYMSADTPVYMEIDSQFFNTLYITRSVKG